MGTLCGEREKEVGGKTEVIPLPCPNLYFQFPAVNLREFRD